MDLLLDVFESDNNNEIVDKRCNEITKILEMFIQYNYALYSLPIIQHPAAPMNAVYSIEQYIRNDIWKVKSSKKKVMSVLKYHPNAKNDTIPILPIYNIMDYCMWFYHIDEQFSNVSNVDDYKMGYWSDISIVSPTSDSILQNPITEIGKLLKNDLV